MAPNLNTRRASDMLKQPSELLPPSEAASSAPVSTAPTTDSDSGSGSHPSIIISTPESIPDELRDVAPLLYGFEFTDEDVAAYERFHGLPETTGMERFTQKLALLGRHSCELDLWMRAFFDAGGACRRPRAPNASSEDIIYFVKRTRNGRIANLLCPTPACIQQLAQALCLSRPVRWIPV